jgi:4-hydroxyphenylpyruvate dioxygenase
VAFASGDVLALARAMGERGAPMLAIPDNYYDDLAARFELDPGRLATLRELGVLYDRDAHGEFLHAFTQTVGERVFFEVVQRVGAYAGYGAVNTPVRLAAQRQAAVAAGAI